MSFIMDSNPSTMMLCPPPKNTTKDEEEKPNQQNQVLVFDSSLQKQSNLPKEFLWPQRDLIHSQDELQEPLIDLAGFLKGDEVSTSIAINLIRKACLSHGFFQITNHGVDSSLIEAAYEASDLIFKLPLSKKLSMRRKPGSVCGYSGAHADRYSSKLLWKETFSFPFHANNSQDVVDYFKSSLGEELEHAGWIYQKYCEEMKEVSLMIFELLGMSLGIDRMEYKKYYEDGSSIMRCNNYPPCNNSGLTLGTGPHCDPTSLTILHQDQVGGLQVFANNKWQLVAPRPHSLVINIGDTFMALSNGEYKSCMHRAVVNREKERRSLVFFMNPREDKVVRPPQQLLIHSNRKYPDFTWSDLLSFTQNHYRADVSTLQSFFQWLPYKSSSN